MTFGYMYTEEIKVTHGLCLLYETTTTLRYEFTIG